MTNPISDPLREAAQAVLDCWDSRNWKAAPTADYMRRLRAALAAAPQSAPAPADERAAMIGVIHASNGVWEGDVDEIADALLADGWRKADPLADERMAWAVVGRDGQPKTGAIFNWPDVADSCRGQGERVVRVAIRVVEAGA